MNEQEATELELIRMLVDSAGWKNWLLPSLKSMFQSKYLKLRKVKRDADFYKIQGFLDALEQVINLPNTRSADINPESRT